MPGLDFGCGQRRNVLYSVQQNKAGRPDRTGCVSLKKVNAYLIQRPKMLLTMVWVFTLLAVGVGITLIVAFPNMGILPFWGYLIVQQENESGRKHEFRPLSFSCCNQRFFFLWG